MNFNMTENKFLQICYTIMTILGFILFEYMFGCLLLSIFCNVATISIFGILTVLALCLVMSILTEIKVVKFKKQEDGEK